MSPKISPILTLSLCCLLFLLTACGGEEEVDTEATIAAAVAETAAAQPTATPVLPTDTPVPPTDTPVPPTDTPIPPTETATPEPPTPTAEPDLDLHTYINQVFGVVFQHPLDWETEILEDDVPFRFVTITDIERIAEEDLSGAIAFVIGIVYDEVNFYEQYGEIEDLLAKQEAILNDDFDEPAPQSDPILSDSVDGPRVERTYLLMGPNDEELPARTITIFNEEDQLLGTFLLAVSEEGAEAYTPALNTVADSLRLSYSAAYETAEEVARNATPVPTLDPTSIADWDTYQDASNLFSLQYPATWNADQDDLADPFDFLLISDAEALAENDLSGDLGFVAGMVNSLDEEGWAGDLETIHILWIEDNFPGNYHISGVSSYGAIGEVETYNQDYLIINPDDINLATRVITLVQGDSIINLLFIATETGQTEYTPILNAIAQTLTLNPDPIAKQGAVLPADLTLDQSDPVSVVNAIFFAAQTGDYSNLASLCDPNGDNDGDTQAICDITAESDDVDLFAEYFALGQMQGQAEVEGDEASVPFTFGPNGTDEETMNLILRDGVWYLYSF